MQGYCNSESRRRAGPWAARAQPPETGWCWVGGKDNSENEGRSQEKPIQACHGLLIAGTEGGGGGYQSHFPAHLIFFEIPLPSAQIPFPLAEFGKNPSVIHTTSFRFASAKLRLLNTTQQRPKNSQGFTKMF